MRLIHFLNEDIFDVIELKDIKEKIQKECKPWLIASKGYPVWRGMRNPASGKFKVRTERKPLDTPLDVHIKLNEIFKKHFGWQCRSEGLLTTGDRTVASSYGNAHQIFPIGKFRFVWSKNVHDLYSIYVELISKQGITYAGGGDWKQTNLPKQQDPKTLVVKSDDLYLSKKELASYKNIIFKQLDDLIKKEYSDKNIVQAINSLNEIMINCKEYYAI